LSESEFKSPIKNIASFPTKEGTALRKTEKKSSALTTYMEAA
jgi:hypothetical protein